MATGGFELAGKTGSRFRVVSDGHLVVSVISNRRLSTVAVGFAH